MKSLHLLDYIIMETITSDCYGHKKRQLGTAKCEGIRTYQHTHTHTHTHTHIHTHSYAPGESAKSQPTGSGSYGRWCTNHGPECLCMHACVSR
jgi:hypothetical protein